MFATLKNFVISYSLDVKRNLMRNTQICDLFSKKKLNFLIYFSIQVKISVMLCVVYVIDIPYVNFILKKRIQTFQEILR